MPGVWKRAGQVAAIVGLDWPAALAMIPARADRERVQHLLKSYEAGLISGAMQLLAKPAAEQE